MSNNWQAYLDHDLPKVERIPHPTKVIRRPDPKRARKHTANNPRAAEVLREAVITRLKERKFLG